MSVRSLNGPNGLDAADISVNGKKFFTAFAVLHGFCSHFPGSSGASCGIGYRTDKFTRYWEPLGTRYIIIVTRTTCPFRALHKGHLIAGHGRETSNRSRAREVVAAIWTLPWHKHQAQNLEGNRKQTNGKSLPWPPT